jgi:hypothetical protein
VDERGRALLAGGGLGVVLLLVLVALGGGGVPGVGGGPTRGPGSEPVGSLPSPLPVADLYRLFSEPGIANSDGTPVRLSVSKVADLALPSGRVVAADAFMVGPDALPFTRTLAPGVHPVLLLRADFGDGTRSVAAAMVRAGSGDPVRWELALVPGQDAALLGPDQVFGYGTDSGTGSFTSAEAAASLTRARAEGFTKRLLDALGTTAETYRDTADVAVEGSGLNVVAFSSGWGDGAYPSWVGVSPDGTAVELLTSCEILEPNAP